MYELLCQREKKYIYHKQNLIGKSSVAKHRHGQGLGQWWLLVIPMVPHPAQWVEMPHDISACAPSRSWARSPRMIHACYRKAHCALSFIPYDIMFRFNYPDELYIFFPFFNFNLISSQTLFKIIYKCGDIDVSYLATQKTYISYLVWCT